MAPGLSLTDSSAVLAQQAALMLEAAAHEGSDPALPDIAARLGVAQPTVAKMLSRLAADGLVTRKDVYSDSVAILRQVGLLRF